MGVATASTGASLQIGQLVGGKPRQGFLGSAAFLHATDANPGLLEGSHRTGPHAAHDDDLAIVQQPGEGAVIVAVGTACVPVPMESPRFRMIVTMVRAMSCLRVLTHLPVQHGGPFGFENQESFAAAEVR